MAGTTEELLARTRRSRFTLPSLHTDTASRGRLSLHGTPRQRSHHGRRQLNRWDSAHSTIRIHILASLAPVGETRCTSHSRPHALALPTNAEEGDLWKLQRTTSWLSSSHAPQGTSSSISSVLSTDHWPPFFSISRSPSPSTSMPARKPLSLDSRPRPRSRLQRARRTSSVTSPRTIV